MKGAFPEARYALLKLVPPNIWVFSGRQDYKVKTGLSAPVPDFSRAWKPWLDRTAQGTRRVSYQFLDVGDDGNVMRTSDGRPAYYSDMLPEHEASTVNFPPEGNYSAEVDQRVKQTPTLPLPIRTLFDDEDIARDPFGLFVVNTDLRDAGRVDSTLDGKLVEILRVLAEIKAAVAGK